MSFLSNPALSGKTIGSPEWFAAQRTMIKNKPLVRRCYDLWYTRLAADAAGVPPEHAGATAVELGSGSGYLKQFLPDVVTSDIAPGIADMVIDGRELPFPDSSVRAILLTHVFHHIPDVRAFFREADRVLVPGGVVSMIDCAHTPFSRLFFGTVHPEPYDYRTREWSFKQADGMLDSNQALSWIVFSRDRDQFVQEFPGFEIGSFEYLPWLGYLLSGGVNLRSLVPAAFPEPILALERLVGWLDPLMAIHWHLCVRKRV